MNKQLKIVLLLAGGLVLFGAAVGIGLFYLLEEPEKDGPLITTSSGLKYLDRRVGVMGEPVKLRSVVTVHYVGSFPDGRVFEDSHIKNEPFTFVVGNGDVIKAWDEGVMGMKVGGKRKLFVPAKLGYAEKGKEPKIPPNADLVFEIELLQIG